ncbi:MAG: tetratricopeptide repeat protein, partial [Jaaginema sp. PMC 1079.18]|nr:tetratricopeptide repeat protein [Jaaginema sp. PMC 1079.18]
MEHGDNRNKSYANPSESITVSLSEDETLQNQNDIDIWLERGVAQQQTGNFVNAQQTFEKARLAAQSIEDSTREVRALAYLGICFYSQGGYGRAIACGQQGLAIARRIGDRFLEGQIWGNLGNAYRHEGDYERAIDAQQKSLELLQLQKDKTGQ